VTKRVFIKTWGCQMNEHDAERMAGLVAPMGYALTADPENADLILLNTCSIRDKAEQKVYSDLGRLDALKAARPDLVIGVAGCVAQQEGRAILLSSHQMGEMERICDSVMIISRGAIVASGKAADLARERTSVVFCVPVAEAARAVLHEVQGISNVEVLGPDRVRVDSPAVPTAEINRVLVKRGIDVIAITEEKESLEEIFFRLAGRDHDVA